MKNKFIYEEDIRLLKREIRLKEVAITELRRKLKLAQKQKDEIQQTVEIFENSSKNLSKLLDCQIHDKCKIGLGYNTVSPPYIENFFPLKPDLSCLEEFVNEPIVSEPIVKKPVDETSEAKASADKPELGNLHQYLQDKGVIDSGCSRHMSGNMSYLTDYEEIDGGYLAFGGNLKGGKITGREVVNTACYVQNRVLVFKPYNKTPYELFHGRTPALRFMRPFGYPVTILNTKDHLGKFDGSKPNWLFDIDALTKSMNYKLVIKGNQSNGNAGTKACDDAGKDRMETVPGKDYILLPLWIADLLISQESKSSQDDGFQPLSDHGKKVNKDPRQESKCKDKENEDNVNNTNNVNVASINGVNVVGANTNNELPFDPEMPELEDISTFNFSNKDEDDGAEADMNNLDTPTIRIHKDHLLDQVIGDLHSTTQTRNMYKNLEEHGFVTTIHQRTNHKDLQNCLFACFLSQEELIKIEEEVYVCQPPGFEDLEFPDKEYNVEKVLYGLHQAPRACDYAGASLDRKSSTEGCQYVGCRLISWQCKKQTMVANSTTEAEYVAASSCCGQVLWIQYQLLDYGKPRRHDTEVPQLSVPTSVADKAINEEMYDSLERAATTATSLDVEQDRGGGPTCQEAMGDAAAQTKSERVFKISNDSLINRVLDLETTKITQAMKISSLKRRVKKLEGERGQELMDLKYSTRDVDVADDLKGEEVFVLQEVPLNAAAVTTTTATIDDITLAQALVELKSERPKATIVTVATTITTTSSRPKAKGIVIHDQERAPAPTVSSQQPSQVKEKGKAKMIEELVKLKKKDQIQLDKEVALKLQEELQAKFEMEQRLENYELAQRLQAEEQDELTDAEKAKLFMEFLEKRRKFFVAKRAKEKRNRLPTKAQQRNIMSTYLKDMD
nr:putative reverse transcriptase, RNA-dependent DNA polymerase [Tanacetum cinerariifolium]